MPKEFIDKLASFLGMNLRAGMMHAMCLMFFTTGGRVND
jgi:hypothetical protein